MIAHSTIVIELPFGTLASLILLILAILGDLLAPAGGPPAWCASSEWLGPRTRDALWHLLFGW